MSSVANESPASAEAARRRLDARLRSAGVELPDVSSAASEDERRRAAAAAIEALRRGAAKPPVDAPEPAPVGTPDLPPIVAPVPEPPAAPTDLPTASPSRVRPRAPRVGRGERLLSAVRARLWPGALIATAIVAAVAGFSFARWLAPVSEGAMASDADPVDVPVVDASAGGTGNAVAGAFGDGDELFDADRNALLSDNLRLQRALVTLEAELATLRGAPSAGEAVGQAVDPMVDPTVSPTLDQAADLAVDDPTVLQATDLAADESVDDVVSRDVAALAEAGIDEAELESVARAVADADVELGLIELGGGDPSADPADLARARLGARQRLLDAIGTEAFVAARAARGEPNRLTIESIPDAPAYSALNAGDALLAIDGQPVFDADDVLAADTVGPRELVVLRRGERASFLVDAALAPIAVTVQSLPAWAWVPPTAE